MVIGQAVTIVSHNNTWKDARIVGVGTDNLDGTHDVFIVQHSHFENDLEFYQQADAETGKRYNAGNSAFWLEQ